MNKREIILTPPLISKITGGVWYNLDSNLKFYGMRVNPDNVRDGDLFFCTTPEHWGEKILNTHSKLESIFAKGAVAAVITDSNFINITNKPLLLVSNGYHSLKELAFYIRDTYKIPRVLVTGTEGKSGFKKQLYSLLSYQTKPHASIDSANLNVPILCSLASLSSNNTVEIIEASVAQPNVGITRSGLVKPDICVITQLGHEHIKTHGSVDKMISHKASIVTSLKNNGICVLNKNNDKYDRCREEIYKIKYVDIRSFGKDSSCNAFVVYSVFDEKKLTWQIKANVEGHILDYVIPLIGAHIPVASLAPLMCVHYLGYDLIAAAQDFASIKGSDTMGCYSKIVMPDRSFHFMDHSHRASVLSYHSALEDLTHFKPDRQGRKVAVIGNMLNIGDISEKAHEDLACLIENADVDFLYTVGDYIKPLHKKLKNPEILKAHGHIWKDIEKKVLADIQDGDVLFIKGHHRIWLKYLAEKIYNLGKVYEIR